MIILPQHKKIEDEVITAQLSEWLYQSHCWDAPAGNAGLKICKWCGARSIILNQLDKGKRFCPENPIIKQIFQNAAKLVRDQINKNKGWENEG